MHTTRFCLIRHGETDWNRERRLQGHLDIPLNPQGMAQAERLATALQRQQLQFAALHVSELTRARQTAAAISRQLALPLHTHAALKERHYGAFQGRTFDEAREHIPHVYRLHQERDLHFDLQGGESLLAFQQRIMHCMQQLATHHAGQQILVVSHGGVLEMVYRTASGKGLSGARDFPIPNAALNWVNYQDGSWHIEKWADQAHLDDSLDEV
ncbi:histidine phosphatase family protein [Aquitalea sp. ASV15]|uniref:histidine phosphatase family protein n=1 Tax=Aquitalea sp. ASV15 TaxID=2795104 RepID=UPI0018ECDBE3|nr:histidine phosphatase family protein [Aquitalea sp. ASV15]